MSLPVPPRAERAVPPHPSRAAAWFRRILPVPLLSGLCTFACADPVFWGSRAFGAHETSGGKAWGPEFTLELGVFRGGFRPTPENVDDWPARWIALGTAVFDPEEGRYAGLADDSHPLPAGAGDRVFFWASDGSDLTRGPEWLLLAHPDWTWSGRPGGPPGLPNIWIAEQAAEAVVGETGGDRLATVALRPAPVPLEAWLARWFPQDVGLRDPDADPDGDGLSNRAEYLLGSDPTEATAGTPRMSFTPHGVRLALERNPYALSTAVLETSADLRTWTPADATTETERPDRIEMLAIPRPGERARFFRFNLQPAVAE